MPPQQPPQQQKPKILHMIDCKCIKCIEVRKRRGILSPVTDLLDSLTRGKINSRVLQYSWIICLKFYTKEQYDYLVEMGSDDVPFSEEYDLPAHCMIDPTGKTVHIIYDAATLEEKFGNEYVAKFHEKYPFFSYQVIGNVIEESTGLLGVELSSIKHESSLVIQPLVECKQFAYKSFSEKQQRPLYLYTTVPTLTNEIGFKIKIYCSKRVDEGITRMEHIDIEYDLLEFIDDIGMVEYVDEL
jgi:hypothetical protein